MIRIIRAELVRLVRRRTVLAMAAGTVVFALVAGLSVFASAEEAGQGLPSRRGGASLSDLAASGGGTEAFAVGASFGGFLVFVTVIALVATEFSSGTLRALLLRRPHRLQMVAAKLIGILCVVAGMLAAAEVATFAVALAAAPAAGVETSAWFGVDALQAAAVDYGTALAGVSGWAVFGAALAAVFRSAPLALGVGFAWAGPFENIVVESWSPGYRWFPGQVLGSLIRGGTIELGFGRAALTAAAYVGVAAAVAATIVSRKDVTA